MMHYGEADRQAFFVLTSTFFANYTYGSIWRTSFSPGSEIDAEIKTCLVENQKPVRTVCSCSTRNWPYSVRQTGRILFYMSETHYNVSELTSPRAVFPVDEISLPGKETRI